MIQVNLSNVRPFIALPYEAALAPRIHIAHKHLQNRDGVGSDFTGWVRLPEDYDREEFARIQAAAKRIQRDSQALVVIGIGGSYLGARGVIECLCSANYNLKKKNTPNIYFVGNGLSSDQLSEVMELLEGVDYSVNVISKSGTTTEPAVAFRFFRRHLEEKYGAEGAARRIYATTDRARGALKSLADSAGYETFVVPDDVGGRYSVLTAVGLLPIAVAGVDIEQLMAGAAEMMSVCAADDMETNPAWQYAGARYQLYRTGKKIEILAAYEPNFRFMAAYCTTSRPANQAAAIPWDRTPPGTTCGRNCRGARCCPPRRNRRRTPWRDAVLRRSRGESRWEASPRTPSRWHQRATAPPRMSASAVPPESPGGTVPSCRHRQSGCHAPAARGRT